MTDDQFLDLDALAPKDEKPPFRFRFGGEMFTAQNPMGLDIRRIRDLAEDPASQLAFILGPEEWDRLDAIEAEFTIAHAEALAEGFFGHYGLDAPKSVGSAKSSRTIRAR